MSMRGLFSLVIHCLSRIVEIYALNCFCFWCFDIRPTRVQAWRTGPSMLLEPSCLVHFIRAGCVSWVVFDPKFQGNTLIAVVDCENFSGANQNFICRVSVCLLRRICTRFQSSNGSLHSDVHRGKNNLQPLASSCKHIKKARKASPARLQRCAAAAAAADAAVEVFCPHPAAQTS